MNLDCLQVTQFNGCYNFPNYILWANLYVNQRDVFNACVVERSTLDCLGAATVET